jgi:sugar/nucleoside kinase (ribokinase family)
MKPRVVCLGVLILDVLGRPCLELPPGQTGQRVEEIRLTAAGTAAGTAVDFAKLDADVAVVGAVGQDDVGDFLLGLLARYGVDTTWVQRTEAAQTSASMLPIRPNGDRGAYHVVGANAHLSLTPALVAEVLDGATHLHVGGPDSMGGFLTTGLGMVLQQARKAGIGTSLDLLSARLDHARDALRDSLVWVDYFTPNDQQICELYDVSEVEVAAELALQDGAGTVVVTCGPGGCLVARGDAQLRVPALDTFVVDTTGCGDAFTAAFLRAKLLGWTDLAAARLGCAAGGLVATGLGSDAGLVDLASTVEIARQFEIAK